MTIEAFYNIETCLLYVMPFICYCWFSEVTPPNDERAFSSLHTNLAHDQLTPRQVLPI